MIKYVCLLFLLLSGCYPTRCSLEQERMEIAEDDIEWLDSYPPDLSHPLTLNEIIEIAVSRNLELFVKAEEYQIQEDQADKLRWALLPDLNWDYDDSHRSQNTAAYSKFLNPALNVGPPLYQIGSPQHSRTWNLDLAWNVLDFGVTYFRGRQQENKASIEAYEYERIRNSVIFRVVSSYWLAVSSKLALERANILLPEMLDQTEKLKKELVDHIYLSKSQGLGKLVYFYQREIQVRGYNDRNDSSDPTQGYEKQLQDNLLQLAGLMQLPPGAEFDIALPEAEELSIEAFLPPVRELFDYALIYRPELFERDLEYKISADDVNIAILQQFPGVQLFNIDNFDNNPFLLHNKWYLAGVRTAWNLLQFPQNVMDHVIGVASEERDRRNRLLLSQAVLTQVSLAYLQFVQNQEQFRIAERVVKANQAVAALAEKESAVGKKSKLEALQAKIDLALARNNLMKIFAELQNNLEELNNAIGLPRYYKTEGSP